MRLIITLAAIVMMSLSSDALSAYSGYDYELDKNVHVTTTPEDYWTFDKLKKEGDLIGMANLHAQGKVRVFTSESDANILSVKGDLAEIEMPGNNISYWTEISNLRRVSSDEPVGGLGVTKNEVLKNLSGIYTDFEEAKLPSGKSQWVGKGKYGSLIHLVGSPSEIDSVNMISSFAHENQMHGLYNYSSFITLIRNILPNWTEAEGWFADNGQKLKSPEDERTINVGNVRVVLSRGVYRDNPFIGLTISRID